MSQKVHSAIVGLAFWASISFVDRHLMKKIHGQSRALRRSRFEALEPRWLLASDFTNPAITRDVTGDDVVSALDALRIINELNRQGGTFAVPERTDEVTDFFDVTGDGSVSALDALVVINALQDETPPTLQAGLANDTGIDGTNDDGVTSNLSLVGTGFDGLGIAFFTVQFGNDDPIRVFPENDNFAFDPGFAGDGTDDGVRRIVVTATDQRGLVSEPAEFLVELDTQVEFASVEDFFIEDRALGLATLVGATEPLSRVNLGDQTVNSLEDLSFQISGVAVIEGENPLTLTVTDTAGNQRTFQQTFDLSERPEVEFDLRTDSARGDADNADRLTRFPDIFGRVRDLSSVAKLSAGINTDDEATFVDLTDLLSDVPDGGGATFEIDAAAFARVAGSDLPDGEHRLRVIAEDAAGNVSQVASTFFELDSLAPSITIMSPIEGEVIGVGDRLAGQVDLSDPTATLSYRFANGGSPVVINMESSGAFSTVLDFSGVANGPNQIIVTSEDDAGNVDEVTVNVDVQVVVPFQLTNTFPASGQSSVGVTFKPSVQFTSPVDPATVTPDSVYLSTGGVKLDVNVVVSDDGLQATIFPQANLPSSSTISLTVDGDQIQSPDGVVLDGDFDDQPGGLFRADFTTLNMAPIPNTTVVGRVISPGPDNLPFTADDSEPGEDGIRGTDDDVFLLPLAGVEVNLQGGSQVVTTDDQGFYRLDEVPIGEVIVAVHGGTATNIPDDVFYPEFQKRATVFPGQDNTIDGGMFNLFLPRLDKRILRTVSNATGAVITGDDISAPDLPPELRSQLRVEIAPGSLRDAFGNPVDEAEIGIQTVPPELIIDGMPLGLQLIGLDQVITVQALGVRRFAQPARVSMPNLSGSAPGEQLDFLSFDHDQGELLREGAFVVSADGQTITTEEGTGIIHPG